MSCPILVLRSLRQTNPESPASSPVPIKTSAFSLEEEHTFVAASHYSNSENELSFLKNLRRHLAFCIPFLTHLSCSLGTLACIPMLRCLLLSSHFSPWVPFTNILLSGMFLSSSQKELEDTP